MDNNTFWILFWAVLLAGVNVGIALIAFAEVRHNRVFVEAGYRREKVQNEPTYRWEWVSPPKAGDDA